MRTPESWLKLIEKLRKQHTANHETGRWHLNDTIQSKIIDAWAGYHAAIDALLDKSGCAERETPKQSEALDYAL